MSVLSDRIGGLAVCAVAVFGVMAPSVSAPLVSGATVRTFLGGYSGKMVYLKYGAQNATGDLNKNGRSIWYLDFSEETLVEHKICEYASSEPRNPMISFDGTHVVYNTIDPVACYISPIRVNATQTKIADGAQPTWWIKPGTTEEYVFYTVLDIEEGWMRPGVWPPTGYGRITGGATTIMRMVNKMPDGSPNEMIPDYANGGRSKSGRFLFTASRATGVYFLDPTGVQNVNVDSSYEFAADMEGCNPSISPHVNDADVRVMWVNDPHTMCYIAKPQRVNSMADLTATVSKKDDGTTHWDCPQWSTHPNFITASDGFGENRPSTTYNLYIVRLSDKAELKIGCGPANYPHLWVDAPASGVAAGHAEAVKPVFNATLKSGVLRFDATGMRDAVLIVSDLRGKEIARKVMNGSPVAISVGRSNRSLVVRILDRSGVVTAKTIVNHG